MPWNGGVFSRTNGEFVGSQVWQTDRDASIEIEAQRHDAHDQDLAQGINACLPRDGSAPLLGPLDMGGLQLINAAQATEDGEAALLGQTIQGVTWSDYTLTLSRATMSDFVIDMTEVRDSAAAAAQSESNAANSETAAAASEAKAGQWASYDPYTLLPGELYESARSYAQRAADSEATVSNQLVWMGEWDAALNGTPPTPVFPVRYVCTSSGTVDGKAVDTNDLITYDTYNAKWIVTPGTGQVASVDGQIGAVDLSGSYAPFSHSHPYFPLVGGDMSGPVVLPNNTAFWVKDTSGNNRLMARMTDVNLCEMADSAYPTRIHSNGTLTAFDPSAGITGLLRHGSNAHQSGYVHVTTGGPSGGLDGDIWLQY